MSTPFPTASEAAAQARPLYMADQIRQIEVAVKKAVEDGRYRTSLDLVLPRHYDPVENPHRDAAIAAAFPTYGFQYGHLYWGKSCRLEVSWIPAEPLPLIPPIPPAEALFEKLHAAWRARPDGELEVRGALPLPLANVTVAQRGHLLAAIRKLLGDLNLSSEMKMKDDELKYRLWVGESEPDHIEVEVLQIADELAERILKDLPKTVMGRVMKFYTLPIRLTSPSADLVPSFITLLRRRLGADDLRKFTRITLNVVKPPPGKQEMLVCSVEW